MRTLKRILGVLLIFFFGVFIGAAITSAGAMQKIRETLLGGPEAVMDVIVKRLDRELKLDTEQKRKLQAIMDDAHIQLRQSRARVQPEVEATLHEAETRTRAILYPNQLKKFDDFISRGKEKWKAREDAGVAAPATPAPEAPPSTPAVEKPTPIPGPEAANPAPAGETR